jgi:hypothetical protein
MDKTEDLNTQNAVLTLFWVRNGNSQRFAWFCVEKLSLSISSTKIVNINFA